MTGLVRDYIAAAIDRARPQLELFVAGHLECPRPSRLLSPTRWRQSSEIRSIKITPRFPADYPTVDIVVALRVSITARTRRRDVDLGMRTFAIDVEFDLAGTVRGLGYDLVPQCARLTARGGVAERSVQVRCPSEPPTLRAHGVGFTTFT